MAIGTIRKLILQYQEKLTDTIVSLQRGLSPASGKFVLITGVGHCGTKWLATALHHPYKGMVCYHERRLEIITGGLYTAIKHEYEHGIDEFFDSYFTSMKRKLAIYDVVGESNGWAMYMVPEVNKKIPVHLVIHLVRNGILTVNSSFHHNSGMSRNDWIFTHAFRRYWELVGCPDGNWNNYTIWSCWCFYWSLNLHMISWMSKKLGGDRVLVLRLEDLVKNTDTLLNIIQKLNPKISPSIRELEILQKTDVNRKIQSNRSPDVIWARWSDEQREVFKRICGPVMEHYGYEIPPCP